jgi:hypothetical protein
VSEEERSLIDRFCGIQFSLLTKIKAEKSEKVISKETKECAHV